MSFMILADNLLQDAYIIFQSVDNFEIALKNVQFRFGGSSPLNR